MNEDHSWMLPPQAFDWIEKNIPFGSTILEFGSGFGSQRLSKNYNLFSIEHDSAWIGESGGTYLHAPILPKDDFPNEIGWYDMRKITSLLPEEIDLMIVDGPNGTIGRSGLLKHTNLFDWTFPVLIDDLHRDSEKQMAVLLCSRLSLKRIYFEEIGHDDDKVPRCFGVFAREGS